MAAFNSLVSITSNDSNISNKVENEVKICKNEGAYIRGNTVYCLSRDSIYSM
jgi:hypothetical protein